MKKIFAHLGSKKTSLLKYNILDTIIYNEESTIKNDSEVKLPI